ncbi:MAG: hypothetical protein IKG88_07060 [Bacteroidales bacterium]|nr:hypothetical protein [Bacteroidales bacterium]
MKKITLLGVALATIVSVATVSCQKDKITITEFTATMENCNDENGKVMLDGNVLRWTDGDQIAVWGTDGKGIYTTTNTGTYVTTFTFTDGEDPGDPNYTAVYPASWAQRQSIMFLPPVQTSQDGRLETFPMMAKSSASELVFKNLCGALRLRLQASGKSITGIELVANQNIWGSYRIDYNSGNPTLSHYTNGSNQLFLSITTPQSISTQAKDFYITLPPATYGEGFSIRIYTSDGSVCTKTITAGHSFTIVRNGIFTITLNNDDLQFEPNAGLLSGEFSVSPTQKVRFSQGNLMYTGFGTHAVATGGTAEGTWMFGDGWNGNYGDAYSSKWIGTFAWGTSGWNSGANGYLPYHCGQGWESQDYMPGGNASNNLTGTYANADWGVYNAIFNGGNQPGLWRTLSTEEWNYLLNQRTGHSVKWGVAEVGSYSTRYGLVILPDRFSLPDGLDFNEGTSLSGGSSDYSLNQYTSEQWNQMEAAGAVLLEVAWGGAVYFWTTTAANVNNSYVLCVSGGNVGVTECNRRGQGVNNNDPWTAVRLVRDVQ